MTTNQLKKDLAAQFGGKPSQWFVRRSVEGGRNWLTVSATQVLARTNEQNDAVERFVSQKIPGFKVLVA